MFCKSYAIESTLMSALAVAQPPSQDTYHLRTCDSDSINGHQHLCSSPLTGISELASAVLGRQFSFTSIHSFIDVRD